MAREPANSIFLYHKPRCNILFADYIAGLNGSTEPMLCHDDGVATGKHPQRFEMQPCAAEPTTQELMPVTGAAWADDLDTRVR